MASLIPTSALGSASGSAAGKEGALPAVASEKTRGARGSTPGISAHECLGAEVKGRGEGGQEGEAEELEPGGPEAPSTTAARALRSPSPAVSKTIAPSHPPPADPATLSSVDPTSAAGPTAPLSDTGDSSGPDSSPIDTETLLQILDLDEPDNHEFSRGMAWAYFEQAAATFKDMDKAFAQSSLPTLSSLGHFLKGSSAALGVFKVQKSCEQIQHYGELRDEDVGADLGEAEALGRIGEVLTRVKKEYAEAERWLKDYYANLA